VRKQQQTRINGARLQWALVNLQQAPGFGGTGQVGQSSQINCSPGLLPSFPPPKAPIPGLSLSPYHGHSVAIGQVAIAEFGLLHVIRGNAALGTAEIGKQGGGLVALNGCSGHIVCAGAGEQHGGLAAGVGASQDGDRILKGNAQTLDSPNLLEAHLFQKIISMRLVLSQRIPDLSQLSINSRHLTPPPALHRFGCLPGIRGRSCRRRCGCLLRPAGRGCGG